MDANHRAWNRRQRKEVETAVFLCISKLATAVGQAMTKYVHDLLDLMFSCELSEPLVSALDNISSRIKPLSGVIQGNFSFYVCGKPTLC